MSTTIRIEPAGDFHCRAEHGPSGADLTTDLPADNGGNGDRFSPTDLVATGLGTCMMTIMMKAAVRLEVDLSDLRIEVEKEMAAEPARRIGALRTVIEMPRSLTTKQRTVLERAALTCPVHKTLGDTVELPVEFRYPE